VLCGGIADVVREFYQIVALSRCEVARIVQGRVAGPAVPGGPVSDESHGRGWAASAAVSEI
jgi:hypothetical protein